jgi:hypothetical protein
MELLKEWVEQERKGNEAVKLAMSLLQLIHTQNDISHFGFL